MYSKILVPLDGSVAAEHVLHYASALALQSGAELVLDHVSRDGGGPMERMSAAYLVHVGESLHGARPMPHPAYLEHFAELPSANWPTPRVDLPVRVRIDVGAPAPSLIAAIDAEKPSLVVMSAIGETARRRWPIGSVADHVIREAPAPVRLSHPPESTHPADVSPLDRRLLVLLDGSAEAEQVIPHALEHAALCGAAVTLLRVHEPPYVDADYPEATMEMNWSQHVSRMTEHVRDESRTYLERQADRFRTRAIEVSCDTVVDPMVAPSLIRYIMEHDFDLVMMTTHGRSGVSRFLLGSIAQTLMQATSTPLWLLGIR